MMRVSATEPPASTGGLPVTVIGPAARWPDLSPREPWEYRDLLLLLIWRDITIRYKQTVIGVAWAILQPVATTVVASLLLGQVVGLPSDGVPYPVFVYCALAPWTYFTHALTKASLSVVAHQAVITKVYFPRLLLPLGAILAALMDFVAAAVVLAGVLLAYRIPPTAALAGVPLAILLLLITTLGISLWLAALNVEYRDIGNALPFLTQLLLFLTPVFYPSRLIPEPWRLLYHLNPMAGVIDGFRWTVLGQGEPAALPGLALSALVALGILLGGAVFYRRREVAFADVV